jgi:hypothetical protein
MNSTPPRRYIFIDYDNLQQIKFKKLEKVATKIFLFIDAQQEYVPLALAVQMQRLGKRLKWIVVDNPSGSNLNYHLAFVMGKLHQKIDQDIEFAVVSNDRDFDPLVSFINASGRQCLRVNRRKEESSIFQQEAAIFQNSFKESTLPDFDLSTNDLHTGVLVEDEIIVRTAEETIKRLIRSGKRPMELSSLKNYILLHNQELSLHGQIDRIIQKMKDAKDIDIRQGEVIYNF